MGQRIRLQEVNSFDRDGFVERFGPLFEHSPWVAGTAWESRPFSSIEELRRALDSAVYGAPREKQLELLRAHPDLAGKAAVAGGLTLESGREQASAGLDRLTLEEFESFTRVNRAYREKFGIPMIFCVREHTKESILENAGERLENTPEEEVNTALVEVSKIAGLRLQDLLINDTDE